MDQRYAALLAQKKKPVSKKKVSDGVTGKEVFHKSYGKGTITKYDGKMITVRFPKAGIKTLIYDISVEKGTIQLI